MAKAATVTPPTEDKIVYEVIDVPASAKSAAEPKTNPYAEGVTQAKGLMVSDPGKGLRFGVEAGKVVKQINLLRRAGTAQEVSVRVKAYKGDEALSSKLDIYDAMPAGEKITIVFWTVPAIKREKKPATPVEPVVATASA